MKFFAKVNNESLVFAKNFIWNIWRCSELASMLVKKLFSNRSSEVFFKTGVVCNFIKETLAQVFTFEFCEISKNTFSYRTPLMAASEEFWQLRALTSRNEVKAIKSINSIKSVGKYYYEIESWLQQVPLVMEKPHQSECLQLLHQRRKAKKN